MGHSDNRPGNIVDSGIDLNNGGWIIIAILIAIIIVLIIVIVYFNLKNSKIINELQKSSKNEFTDNERNLLLKYRNLNDRDKTVIDNTLSALSEKRENDTTTKE